MLSSFATILVILWLLGFFGFHVLGSYIHILLVITGLILVVRIMTGEK